MVAIDALPGALPRVSRCSLVTTPRVPFYTRAHMGVEYEHGASTYIPTPRFNGAAWCSQFGIWKGGALSPVPHGVSAQYARARDARGSS